MTVDRPVASLRVSQEDGSMPCDRPVNVLLYLLFYYCAKLHLLLLCHWRIKFLLLSSSQPQARLSLRLRRSGKHFFTYTNSFSFAVFECTHEKIYYIKKETIPHMANTNVCRYSQCIAPKTPTTQTPVQLPMSSAVFFVNRK